MKIKVQWVSYLVLKLFYWLWRTNRLPKYEYELPNYQIYTWAIGTDNDSYQAVNIEICNIWKNRHKERKEDWDYTIISFIFDNTELKGLLKYAFLLKFALKALWKIGYTSRDQLYAQMIVDGPEWVTILANATNVNDVAIQPLIREDVLDAIFRRNYK